MKIAKFEFSLFGINTYVVYDPETRECGVIDPGMSDSTEEEAMARFIERNSLKVTHIINTHLHVDHAIGNRYMTEHYGAPVAAHRDDAPLGERLRRQAEAFGMNKMVSDVEITSFLEPGEEIEIGSGKLRVIHVPGHSPGSVALYDKEDGFVIVGDALFAGSIGRTDLPGGDYATLIHSIREELLKLPPQTVVYPGHGPATTIGREAASNPFLR